LVGTAIAGHGINDDDSTVLSEADGKVVVDPKQEQQAVILRGS
jgi:hypothetical protein